MSHSTSDLRIGVARADITPAKYELLKPTGMARREPTRGVLDPLLVEAMAIGVGGERLFVVTSDLRTIGHKMVVEIRTAVSERCDCAPERVLLSSVHNHCSSPEAADDSPEALAALDEAESRIIDGFAAACADAQASRRPAEVAYTTAELREPVGQNRRYRFSGGTCANCWHGGAVCPPGLKYVGPGGPDSTEIRLLAVRDAGGEAPFAVLISYPSHPHLTGVPYFSGETVGAIKAEVESQVPGALVLYGNHTGGDIDMHCVHPIPPDRGDASIVAWFQESQRTIARRVAEVVVPAVAGCTDYERPAWLRHEYYSSGEDDPENSRVTIINTAVLDGFALASIPGELFLSLGQDLQARSPVPRLLLMGYNGSVGGYAPPPLGFEQGSYEVMRGPAATEDDRLEVRPGQFAKRAMWQSGQQIVDRVVDTVGRLATER
jgi:hypothetical protein